MIIDYTPRFDTAYGLVFQAGLAKSHGKYVLWVNNYKRNCLKQLKIPKWRESSAFSIPNEQSFFVVKYTMHSTVIMVYLYVACVQSHRWKYNFVSTETLYSSVYFWSFEIIAIMLNWISRTVHIISSKLSFKPFTYNLIIASIQIYAKGVLWLHGLSCC